MSVVVRLAFCFYQEMFPKIDNFRAAPSPIRGIVLAASHCDRCRAALPTKALRHVGESESGSLADDAVPMVVDVGCELAAVFFRQLGHGRASRCGKWPGLCSAIDIVAGDDAELGGARTWSQKSVSSAWPMAPGPTSGSNHGTVSNTCLAMAIFAPISGGSWGLLQFSVVASQARCAGPMPVASIRGPSFSPPATASASPRPDRTTHPRDPIDWRQHVVVGKQQHVPAGHGQRPVQRPALPRPWLRK